MFFIKSKVFVSLGLAHTHRGEYHSMMHLDQSSSRNLPDSDRRTLLSDTKI